MLEYRHAKDKDVELVFENDYDASYDVYEPLFNELALKTFHHLKTPGEISLEVDLVSDATIHQVNRDYRHVDRPTDVISFAFDDQVEGEVAIKGSVLHDLGVILISIDRALAQAKEYGHSDQREICFLFVHGLLHLLGYNHEEPTDEKKMFALQDVILGKKDSFK
jgi:probable rRNA maturation factor